VRGYQLFDLCAQRHVATRHLREKPGRAAIRATVFRHLIGNRSAWGRPSGDAAAASNKRTLGESPAARKSSPVIFGVKRRLALNSLFLFSAARSVQVTFAGQFRVIDVILPAMSLKALHLRLEVV
jgi:hypothetical protein